MPGFREYVSRVRSTPYHGQTQPASASLEAWLISLGEGRPLVPADLNSARLAAALISFVDDYAGQYPLEAFVDGAVAALIDAWGRAPAPLTLPDLVALGAPQPTLLDQLLLAHAAVRAVARARDTRALPSVRLSLEARCALGAKLLPFPDALSQGGDPLGDVYHWLATASAGLAAASLPRRLWLVPPFAVGPELMWLVRERIAGSVLFFGNHAAVDRAGLRAGLRAGWVWRHGLL